MITATSLSQSRPIASIVIACHPSVSHSSPGVKRRKQNHLQDRQLVEHHSKSFGDSHTLRMAATHGLAAQLLKFCECRPSHRPDLPVTPLFLRGLPVFLACSPPRFVWF